MGWRTNRTKFLFYFFDEYFSNSSNLSKTRTTPTTIFNELISERIQWFICFSICEHNTRAKNTKMRMKALKAPTPAAVVVSKQPIAKVFLNLQANACDRCRFTSFWINIKSWLNPSTGDSLFSSLLLSFSARRQWNVSFFLCNKCVCFVVVAVLAPVLAFEPLCHTYIWLIFEFFWFTFCVLAHPGPEQQQHIVD